MNDKAEESEPTWDQAFEAIKQLNRDINTTPAWKMGSCLEYFGIELMKNVTYLPFGAFKPNPKPEVDYIDIAVMMTHLTPSQIIKAIEQARLKAAGEVRAEYFEEDHE